MRGILLARALNTDEARRVAYSSSAVPPESIGEGVARLGELLAQSLEPAAV